MAGSMIGVIGGSGLYAMDALENVEKRRVHTPFGEPSAPLTFGTLHGVPFAFLPRHGPGHRFSPTDIPYRANIHALKQVGCDRLVSVSATGSLREDLHPGALVVIDQFIDRTVTRPRTFFTDGCVAHVGIADPVCPKLADALHQAAQSSGAAVHRGGTYIVIEGPQFSTRAESELFRQWGGSVIGMTNLPEARLAREAELPYATLALVTDYDCWHEEEDDVNVTNVLAVLTEATQKAKVALVELAKATASGAYSLAGSPAHGALDHAIMTSRADIPPRTADRLSTLLARIWSPTTDGSNG